MRLADSGEVFGHFLIPISEEDTTRKALAAAVARSARRTPISARLTSIGGECDLLLHLYMRDFRIVADLQAEVIDSYSLATSWVYAIPYEALESPELPAGGLEFFVYLRVHRHYYACYGGVGERELVDAIIHLIHSYQEGQLSGRVLYSLGWPDLIIHGVLRGDVQHLRRLIISLQSFTFPTAPTVRNRRETKTPLFLKTITLLGIPIKLKRYRSGQLMPGAGVTIPAPLLLGRSRPGKALQASDSLGRMFLEGGASEATCWALDGTWDLLVTSLGRKQITLDRFYDAIRRRRRSFAKDGIERTQTHFLATRRTELESAPVRTVMLRPDSARTLLTERCSCIKESFDDLRKRLERVEEDRELPKGLIRTISHVLEMFRHTLRDNSNCCDSVGALRAHVHGLEGLLNLSVRAHRLLQSTPDSNVGQQALIATEISFINSHLVEWCKRAGRVVREKTAASSARLFLQVDSVVAQRGAIPKILMIAERIMRDFYRRLPPALHGHGNEVPKRDFAAILEPLGNVTSQPFMGLVSIPVRYAFALHLVVPQLWHEVGQHVFWAEYSPSQRALVNLEIAQESTREEELPLSSQKSESFAIDFHLRADMFADLLVFCFGFAGNLRDFFVYLASLTANVAKHDDLHQQSWERQVLALVQRLVYVAQFLNTHRHVGGMYGATREEVLNECRRVQQALISGREASQAAVRDIVSFLLELSGADGWPERFRIPSTLVDRVAANLQSRVYARCLRDMAYLACEVRGIPLPNASLRLDEDVWRSIESGELVNFSSAEQLEAAYREFYLDELAAQLAGRAAPRRKDQFRKMATLGRSALLYIYESELSS